MKRLTYSNVMATVAVFVALGGTSYAAAKITGADVREQLARQERHRDRRDRQQRGPQQTACWRATSVAGQLPAGEKGDKGEKGDRGTPARWVLIDEAGTILEQSGGFTVISKPGVNGQPATNPNVYVDAGATLVGKGLGATIAIQNRLDRNGDTMPDPAFNGQAAVGRCNTAGINCVPAGTNADDTLVVRSLVDNTDVTSQTRRVYVTVTG